ncbi:hypothetical protein [Streptomyces sp. G45]|uniref:hypothetical protein n=1 Tax=Streptomyces sp. G45 TaxID=3406627 RepID=UPI003C29CEC1
MSVPGGTESGVGAAVRVVRRLVAHEVRGLRGLPLWARRRRHGVAPGDTPAAYTGPQTATLFAFAFLAVVETVALALVVPWPLAHAALLFVDVYTLVQIVAFHAACVTRPHVACADGSLRVRYGQFLDLRIPADAIQLAQVDRRCPEHGKLRVHDDGTVDVAVGGQTTVTVELTRPVAFLRPLGRRAEARVVRLHADEPGVLVAALTAARRNRPGEEPRTPPGPRVTPERTGPSPSPDPLASA